MADLATADPATAGSGTSCPATSGSATAGRIARFLRRAGPGGLLLGNLVVALGYLGLGSAAGIFFARFGMFPAPIWLPAALATCACLAGCWRLVPGLFLGSFLVNALLLEASFLTAALISLSNSLGPLAGAALARALRPPTGMFTRLHGVLGFIAGCVLLCSVITGLGGAATLVLTAGLPPQAAYSVAANWVLSDAGGVFFLAPALMLWLGLETTPANPGHRVRAQDRLVLAATAGMATLIFGLPPDLARLVQPEAMFLLTIPVTWVTLRISLGAAYSLLTAISVVATVGTLAGLGPFQPDQVANPLRAVGLMVVLMATNALVLMALLSERREAEALLAAGNARLVEEVAARTRDLVQMAQTDDLTGIANRGHFLRLLEAGFAAARDGRGRLALLVLELDHFRPLNDMRGHAAGNVALRGVVEICNAQMLGWDARFGRLGGEVFAVLLPDVGPPEAVSLAEGLRAAIARHSFRTGDDEAPARLTASVGVTATLPGDRHAEDLLHRADAAVFLAKAKGRNRVELRLLSEMPQEMRASNLSR